MFKLRLLHVHTKVITVADRRYRVDCILETRRHYIERVITVSLHLLYRVSLLSYGIWFDFTQPNLNKAGSYMLYVRIMIESMSTTALLTENIFGKLYSDLSMMISNMEYHLRKYRYPLSSEVQYSLFLSTEFTLKIR